ncbi:membrane-bound ClpP family serine protease [Bradyrhizobium sp. LM3.6]
MQTMKAALVATIGIVACLFYLLPGSAEENRPLAITVTIGGAIGPASASYLKEALVKAGERRAEIVILRMNTPGGLNSSMREIIADVLASSVPVIGYVAPAGAHAASAGTYILYATHIAAMAPGTNIGAATPVQIGGPLPGLPSGTPDKDGKDKKDEPKDAMTAKVTNDAVAFIRSLAELRGRNADWAERRRSVRPPPCPPTARCRCTPSTLSRAIRPTCSGKSMVATSRLRAARRNVWQRRTPSSKPSIPGGSPDSWRSSPIPTSRSFS